MKNKIECIVSNGVAKQYDIIEHVKTKNKYIILECIKTKFSEHEVIILWDLINSIEPKGGIINNENLTTLIKNSGYAFKEFRLLTK